jgi:hypothetical protein
MTKHDRPVAEKPRAAEDGEQRRPRRIQDLNDTFRQSFVGGRIVMTAGVAALDTKIQAELLARVRRFYDFTVDNDPYDEHDFGAVRVADRNIFWKIDYYDPSLTAGSEDPTDPARTIRLLTVMLAECPFENVMDG